MTDDPFDELVREAAREYHAPPDPPREEMWAAIGAARAASRAAARADRRAPRRLPPWAGWATGIAAALLVGVGLGRLAPRPDPAAPAASAPASPAPPASPPATTAYRLVAAEHLGQAELLLASFRREAERGAVDAAVAGWAKELLSTTRLMLDSPAAVDPELRVLLEDLELVLAQIAQLPTITGTEVRRQEVRLVTAAIEDAGVLPKLHTAIRQGETLTATPE